MLIAVAALAAAAVPAHAEGKFELYGLRMVPTDDDSKDYSRPGWGGGLQAVAPLPGTATMVAGVFGLEVVNLLSTTKEFRDPLTGLRVEQQTAQNYWRVFAGGRFGPHGRGALRPYAGLNVAAVYYSISTDAVVPDDYDREQEIRQKLGGADELAFGWDANAGLDVNFSNRFSLDVGVRWLHQYGVPQQLGAGAVTIEPAYLQAKVGVGIGFGVFD
jgi:opacity protein-like surface antigen